jgi:DNA-binding CsgD family transcriptional regulator/tetratricopeptide (TPR) repeat protein
MRVYAGAGPLVGRASEIERVNEALHTNGGGDRCVVLVHGEPGIGKTRLVSDLCLRERDAGSPVLWAQCVRFGASSAPYLPLLSALRAREADAPVPAAEVTALLEALDGELNTARTSRLVGLLDSALAAIGAGGPMMLVVDDVQWADPSTLDLLAYLVAASALPVPLSLVLTYRDTELGDGHPLLGWLGDVLRLPGVLDLRLARLAREDTEHLVTAVFGRRPPMTLVDDVQRHTGGNPYLTELLVRDLPSGVTTLPAGLPDGLRTALMAAWHRLGAAARETTRLLAVAGRPVGQNDLADVAEHLGLVAGLRPALAEATTAGVLSASGGDLVWFHHPLLAEVLYESLTPSERVRLHAAFVDAWAATAGRDPALAGHLALHCERAGLLDRAFGYALAASRHAATVRAYPEEAEQLLRAAELSERVQPATREGISRARLWCDAAEAASRAGWDGAALDAAKTALQLVHPEEAPGTAARALRLAGRFAGMARVPLSTQPSIENDREAVRLSGLSDDLEEQAMCLAELSDSTTWAGDRAAARALADQALAKADQAGSDRARAWALAARSTSGWPSQQSLDDADRSQRLALASGHVDTIQHTCIGRANTLEVRHDFAGKADQYVTGYERAVAEGYVRQRQLFAAYAAQALMDVARYDDARRMLREALSFPGAGGAGLAARLNAVHLELMMGDVEAATHHLHRARELAPDLDRREPHLLVKYHVVTGHPERAVEVAASTPLQLFAGDIEEADWLLLLAAMAAGDLATSRTPEDEDLSRARDALTRMIAQRRGQGGELFAPVDEIARAHHIILHAEEARAFSDPDEAALWAPLGDISDDHGEAWTVTVALLHWSQALARRRVARGDLAPPLRRAHERARLFGFQLVLRDVEMLARRARVPLESPVLPAQRAGQDGDVLLTPRERQVLGHLAAGRSYAEIAATLFISQKTVSVHVTHLLQKTGTSSRAEAAAWAWAHGLTQHE